MLKTRFLRNSFIIILCAVLCIFTFCSCQNENRSKQEKDSITFTDALGRSVTVQKNPKRVACLIGSLGDVWISSGGSLCACSEDGFTDFGIDSKDAVNIGGAHSPNAELLLASNPDFVIASASTSSNIQLLDTLEQAGITVAYFDVDSFYDYLDMLKICTDITEREDLYHKNGKDVEEKINTVKSRVLSNPLPEENNRILLVRASSGFIKAKGSGGTVLGEMLKDMGCVNIADSDKSLLENLSSESIIEKQPYRVFAVAMGDEKKAYDNLNNTILNNPSWQSLEAVKCGRVHIMDKRLFNLKPNARWWEAYEQLEKILYQQ